MILRVARMLSARGRYVEADHLMASSQRLPISVVAKLTAEISLRSRTASAPGTGSAGGAQSREIQRSFVARPGPVGRGPQRGGDTSAGPSPSPRPSPTRGWHWSSSWPGLASRRGGKGAGRGPGAPRRRADPDPGAGYEALGKRDRAEEPIRRPSRPNRTIQRCGERRTSICARAGRTRRSHTWLRS
jgi:hypothetical protein